MPFIQRRRLHHWTHSKVDASCESEMKCNDQEENEGKSNEILDKFLFQETSVFDECSATLQDLHRVRARV